MSDQRLRDLERLWLQTRDPAEGARYLQERQRLGLVERSQLELAAWLGDPAARHAVGFEPPTELSLGGWIKGFTERGPEWIDRAKCAVIRETLPHIEARYPRARGLREGFEAYEAWVRERTPRTRALLQLAEPDFLRACEAVLRAEGEQAEEPESLEWLEWEYGATLDTYWYLQQGGEPPEDPYRAPEDDPYDESLEEGEESTLPPGVQEMPAARIVIGGSLQLIQEWIVEREEGVSAQEAAEVFYRVICIEDDEWIPYDEDYDEDTYVLDTAESLISEALIHRALLVHLVPAVLGLERRRTEPVDPVVVASAAQPARALDRLLLARLGDTEVEVEGEVAPWTTLEELLAVVEPSRASCVRVAAAVGERALVHWTANDDAPQRVLVAALEWAEDPRPFHQARVEQALDLCVDAMLRARGGARTAAEVAARAGEVVLEDDPRAALDTLVGCALELVRPQRLFEAVREALIESLRGGRSLVVV